MKGKLIISFLKLFKNHAQYLLLTLLVISLSSKAQFNAASHHIDLGTVSVHQKYINIFIQNLSETTINQIYRIEGEEMILMSGNLKLTPGNSHKLSVALNKFNSKKFQNVINLKFNNCPNLISLTIKGKVEKPGSRKDQKCPDFSKRGTVKVKPGKTRNGASMAPDLILNVNKEYLVSPKPLSENKFHKNNLILLVDISSSMQNEDKKEIVKEAFVGLAEIIRPTDQITLMAYSGNARTVIDPTKNLQQEILFNALNEMKIEGFTNGSLGIKIAYELADSTYMHGANNEIILLTDGAFNANETDDIENQIIKKYAGKGIKLSILGIENKAWAIKELKELCATGNGSYHKVNNTRRARIAMKKTIKAHSQK